MVSSEDVNFNDYLHDLDREQVRVIIRAETRRFKKPTTLISGLPKDSLEMVSRELKKRLATGGSAKDGLIILQGDHRESAKELLLKLGYPASSIEVQ